jgi:hypothetical protein
MNLSEVNRPGQTSKGIRPGEDGQKDQLGEWQLFLAGVRKITSLSSSENSIKNELTTNYNSY